MATPIEPSPEPKSPPPVPTKPEASEDTPVKVAEPVVGISQTPVAKPDGASSTPLANCEPDVSEHGVIPVVIGELSHLLSPPKGSKHSNKMSTTGPEPLTLEISSLQPIPLVNPMISETGDQIDVKKWRDGPITVDAHTPEPEDDEELILSDGDN